MKNMNFMKGCTTGFRRNGVFFFYGLIKEYGKNILHNAALLKHYMDVNDWNYAYVSAEGSPAFFDDYDYSELMNEMKQYNLRLFYFDKNNNVRIVMNLKDYEEDMPKRYSPPKEVFL